MPVTAGKHWKRDETIGEEDSELGSGAAGTIGDNGGQWGTIGDNRGQ